MAQARRAVREERLDDAQGILVNVVVNEPRNDEAWVLLAETLTDPQRKLECLEKAHGIDPRNAVTERALQAVRDQIANAATPAPAETLTPVPAASPDSAPVEQGAAHPELAAPLLEGAEPLAREVLLSTDPNDTRSLGLTLVEQLEAAAAYDDVATHRWSQSAGRDALVKYERAVTMLITNLPQTDPQLDTLRGQRRRALALLRAATQVLATVP